MLKKKNPFSFKFSPENLIGSTADLRNFNGKLFKEKKTKQNNPTKSVKPSPPKNQTYSCDSQGFFVSFNNLLFEKQNQQNKKT